MNLKDVPIAVRLGNNKEGTAITTEEVGVQEETLEINGNPSVLKYST